MSSDEVKALQLLWGLMCSKNIGILNFIMVGDSMIVTKAMKGENKICWHATLIIKDAQGFLNRLSFVSINHTFKEGNQVVDNLASYGHSINENL